jgi:hypothetical protein
MRGKDGLEGMPLKLAIVAAVIAISTPIIYGGLRSYETAKLEGELESEACAIAEFAKMLYIGGPGNAGSIHLNLRGGVTAHVDYVLVGDEPGAPFESCIRYRVRGQPEKPLLVESPNVPLRGADGTAFELSEGAYDIVLECKASDGGPYVEVRRAT